MSTNSNTISLSPLANAIAEALPPPATHSGIVAPVVKPGISFLNRDSDVQLIADSGKIVASMTGNASFPTPFPTLAVVAAAHDAFAAAVSALDRSKASVVGRNQARAVLTQGLRDMALYVQHASAGDPQKLVSSGYPLQRKRGPANAEPPVPQDVRVRQSTMSGRLLARCKADQGAKTYQWRIATTQAPTAWTQFDAVTVARFTFDALVPGTQYIVQVRTVARGGTSNWSDAVAMFSN